MKFSFSFILLCAWGDAKSGKYTSLLVLQSGLDYSKSGVLELHFEHTTIKKIREKDFFKRKCRFIHKILIPLHEIIINYTRMANLNRIKLVLVEKNKTGKWLADELGKTPCTVSKWCQNTIQPDLKTLNEIADLLEVDVTELIVSKSKKVE